MGQDLFGDDGPLAESDVAGARVVRGALDRAAQEALVTALRQIVAQAPLHQPRMRNGQPLSVRMTAAGLFGWTSDASGYRYTPTQANGSAWPAIPAEVLALWQTWLPEARAPECCLINYYTPEARMGLHQDRDEADLTQPVLSISLGDDALFRIGGPVRKAPTRSVWLRSGDLVILEGASRLAFHGVDRVKGGTSDLLERPGRINLTLRVVT